MKTLYTLSEEDYNRLAPYIVIVNENSFSHNNFYNKREELPAVIDLNTADSALLVRLNVIGPTLANKIVERRKALGSILKHDKL